MSSKTAIHSTTRSGPYCAPPIVNTGRTSDKTTDAARQALAKPPAAKKTWAKVEVSRPPEETSIVSPPENPPSISSTKITEFRRVHNQKKDIQNIFKNIRD